MSEENGWGRHIWDVRPQEWVVIRQYQFASQLLFTYSVALAKASVLIFYMRFCTTRKFKVAIWVTAGLLTSWVIGMSGLIIFQCHPVSNFWMEIKLTEYRTGCLPNEADWVLIHGIISVVLDIIVLILPIPTVLQLGLPTKQKIGLIAMFSLGLIVCLAGCLRIVSIRKTILTLDIPWYGYDLYIYTSTEAHVGIICASVPSLKPLLAVFFPRLVTTSYSAGTRRRSGMGPYNGNDMADRNLSGHAGHSKGYQLNSLVESRIGSEETVYRSAHDEESSWLEASSPTHIGGVMKTTRIDQEVLMVESVHVRAPLQP
ncbi:hypothetical protein DRE_00256 [Drechslerella stenobrocha 248]|uniref:Rhodopsin domain-containing protein n=1 Tax=Drechslerella stenobrocha 248 TaxID=1043628 RepID=W7HXL5_9PEZI|nr:hypothetical protein DRE_00256 [Drechslerella stenobrocha 248]